MHKDLLKGKYVMYMGLGRRCEGCRLGRVVNVVGNTLTIRDAYKERHRISRKTHEIFGVLVKRKIRFKTRHEYLEEIQWN